MAVIDKFLGQRVMIPEDRRYQPKQGLWARLEDDTIEFGLTQPALVLCGGIKDLDWLVPDGQAVSAGESVVFAITGKLLYLDAPLPGVVRFNTDLREDLSGLAVDPYTSGWIFRIIPPGDPRKDYDAMPTAEEYLAHLKNTEGFKNPEGIKGGVSGMCKAVYTGINQQKI